MSEQERTSGSVPGKVPAVESDHWLVRPATIRRLWIGFVMVLAGTVLLEIVISIKGYFGIDNLFGFGALYGFGCCVLMVVAAKGLGVLLKRPEDYFDD